MKKKLALLLCAVMMVTSLTACGKKEEPVPEEPQAQEETSAPVNTNPLLAAEFTTKTLLDPATNTEHGQRAYINMLKEDLKEVSEPQMREFYDTKVKDSGLMWVSIICEDGTGIYFPECKLVGARYGNADSMGRVATATGYLALQYDVITYTEEEPLESYTSGTYEVGTEVPAGEYILIPDKDAKLESTCFVSNPANNEEQVAYLSFVGTRYITLTTGQKVELTNCTAYPIAYITAQKVDNSNMQNGMYKVGVDVTAGKFQVEPIGESGTVEIVSDSTGTKESILVRKRIKKKSYVVLKEGHYLRLTDVKLVLLETENAVADADAAQADAANAQNADTQNADSFNSGITVNQDDFQTSSDMTTGDTFETTDPADPNSGAVVS